VLPLILVSVGLSGVWLGYLRLMGPYSPLFIAASIALLGLSWHRVFRRAGASASNGTASCRRSCALCKGIFWTIAGWTLLVLLVPVVAPLFY